MVKFKFQITIIFLLLIFFFVGFLTFKLAMDNKWFERSVLVYTELTEGDGLRAGTQVTVRGLRVGEVKDIEILKNGNLRFKIGIKKSFFENLNKDAHAQVRRSLLISDKKIDIMPGISSEKLKENAEIPGDDSREITDLLSSGRLYPYLEKFEFFTTQLLKLTEEFQKDDRVLKIVKIYDELLPTLRALHGSMESNVPSITRDISSFREKLVDEGGVQNALVQMNELLDKMNLVLNRQDVMGMTQELRDTLRETSVTMRALQKIWLLNSESKEARKELHLEKELPRIEVPRAPANFIDKDHED